jgi:hypothetical protein
MVLSAQRKEFVMRRTALVLALGLALVPSAATAGSGNFRTHLTGDEEVPANESLAQGQAIFKVTDPGLAFRLNVANIENVFAAHIHCGAVGVNGPVGVTLFMAPGSLGPVNGTLSTGTITAPDPENGCGWTDLEAVLAAMEAGDTYVNVHTNDGVDPPNTGPGDFPGGEIRGQL